MSNGNEAQILASCHCGAIQLQVAALPDSYTLCNCSTCRRYAARWLYYRRSDVKIVAQHGALGIYIWGDRMINFCHCKTCGCLTHYEDVERTAESRVALNGNMLSPELLQNLRVRKFDGADTFREIE
jgi:hypothetical protein